MTHTILQQVFETIEQRKNADSNTSYTAQLYAAGTETITQKIGEEATETIIAALSQTKDDLIAESADLLYHLMVLWAHKGISLKDVEDILASRQGVSGIEEKQSRK